MASLEGEQKIAMCTALVYFENRGKTNAGSGRCTTTPEKCYLKWMQDGGEIAKVINGKCEVGNTDSPEAAFQP